MNPKVWLLLQFVPLLLLVGVYTVFAKLSAVVRRFNLSWTNCLLFALVFSVTGIAIRGSVYFANVTVPLPLSILLSISITLVLSGWFLRQRATGPDAQPVGFAGGVQLGAVLVALASGVSLVLFGVLVCLVAYLK